jgi:hypothetical protein
MVTRALFSHRRGPFVILSGLAVLAVAVVGVAVGVSVTAAPETQAREVTLDPVVHLDRTVRDGPIRFHVSTLEPNVGAVHLGNLARHARGEFVLVDVRVSNTGHAPAELEEGVQRVYDAGGRAYSSDATADYYLNFTDLSSYTGSSPLFNRLAPGEQVEGQIAFDVPPQTDLSKLVLHSSPGSPGAVVPLP